MSNYTSVGVNGLVVAIYACCVIFILYTTVLAFWKPPRAKDSPLAGLTWARASLAIATLWLALHLTAAAITVTANRGSSLIVGYFHIRTISTSLGFVVFAIVSVTQVQVIRSRISNPGLGLSRSVPLAAFGLACVLSATRFILIEVGMAKRITTPWTVATVIDLVLALVLFFEAVMLLFFCVRTKKAVDLTAYPYLVTMFGMSALRQLYVLIYCAIVCIGGFVEGESFSNSFLDNLRGAPTTANARPIVSVLSIFSAFIPGLTIVSCLALSYAVLSDRLGKVWNSLFFPMARAFPRP